jgi:hypothetical protein
LWAYFTLYRFNPPPVPPNATNIGIGLFYNYALPTGQEIVIAPTGSGECILDIPETISPGGK